MSKDAEHLDSILRTHDDRQRRKIIEKLGKSDLERLVLHMVGLIDPERQNTEAQQLRAAQEEMKDRFEFRQKSAIAVANNAEDEYVKLKGENRWLRGERQRLLHIAPELPEKDWSLVPNDNEVLEILSIDDYGRSSFLPATEHCHVAMSIVVDYGERWEKRMILKNEYTRPIYPGTAEDLEKEINHRVLSIIGRSPTIDDISYSSDLPVSKEALVKAMLELAIPRYAPSARDEYRDSTFHVFDIYIKPHLHGYDDAQLDEAKNIFGKVVHASFKNMEARRNIPESRPLLPIPRGRRPGTPNRKKK